jgi:biotin operon repressor
MSFREGRTMDATTQVIDAMKAAGEPLNAGKIAEMTGLDRKDVDKAMDQLKKSGAITSPKRCYWQPS